MAPEKQTILQVGSVFEKYRIEGVLGKGGMGEVYLLRHQVLDSLFALKILFPDVAQKTGNLLTALFGKPSWRQKFSIRTWWRCMTRASMRRPAFTTSSWSMFPGERP